MKSGLHAAACTNRTTTTNTTGPRATWPPSLGIRCDEFLPLLCSWNLLLVGSEWGPLRQLFRRPTRMPRWTVGRARLCADRRSSANINQTPWGSIARCPFAWQGELVCSLFPLRGQVSAWSMGSRRAAQNPAPELAPQWTRGAPQRALRATS